MTLYSGPCEGGPFDGKPMHHGLTHIEIAMRGNKVITYVGAPTPEIELGVYRYEGGKWIWYPPVS